MSSTLQENSPLNLSRACIIPVHFKKKALVSPLAFLRFILLVQLSSFSPPGKCFRRQVGRTPPLVLRSGGSFHAWRPGRKSQQAQMEILAPLSLRELPMTDTELTLIAAAAIMGESRIPRKG